MISFELSTQEIETLIDVLESYLSDLRMQIADTDSSFFRKDLKSRKEILNKILDRLRQI